MIKNCELHETDNLYQSRPRQILKITMWLGSKDAAIEWKEPSNEKFTVMTGRLMSSKSCLVSDKGRFSKIWNNPFGSNVADLEGVAQTRIFEFSLETFKKSKSSWNEIDVHLKEAVN